jgi:hypothetical protein
MRIIKASYGGVDFTELIQSKVKNNKLNLRASNNIFGDVNVGVLKWLEIEAEINGVIFKEKYKENTICVLPKPNIDRLGILYSNNINPKTQPTIKEVLKQLEKISKNKADIYTCMWKPQEENPFIEYIAWTQTFSHLNQLLQILQLLYSVREIHNYKYVSFLEHDVLYGDGYFDFEDFDNGNVLTNMNYIGINKNGYQPLKQNDEPFHQMTMRFDDAIKHCESILPNSLITNSGMIEPQNMTRIKWKSLNPSIHINHGHHFTSHYTIYSIDSYYKTHPYWGEHSNWINLFKSEF